MFKRTSSDRLIKKVRLLLLQKTMEQRIPAKSIGSSPGETAEDRFVRSLIDTRLTAEENVILLQKLSEVREALIAMIISNRESSHDKDYVAG